MVNSPADAYAGKGTALASANDKLQVHPDSKQFYKTAVSEEVANQTEDEKRLAKEMYERYYWLRKARKSVLNKDIEEIWDMAEQNMTNYVETLPADDDRSNLFIPVTHSTVDSILAEWYGQHTTGKVMPSTDPEDAPKAEIVDLVRQYVERKNDVLSKDALTQYEILTYGNGIQYIYYKEQLRKVHEVSGQDTNGAPTYKEKIIVDFDDICIENQDIRMFFPDDAARSADFSDMRDCIQRKIVPMQDFEIEYSKYPNYKYVKVGGDLTEIDFFKKPRDLTLFDVEVLVWWNKNRDFKRIVANGILLEDKPIPYDHKDIPFAGAGDNRRPGSFWWIGEPELIEPLQEELNVKRNIRTDAERIAVLSPIFAPTSGRLEEDEIIVSPGKIYYYQGVIAPSPLKQNVDFNVSFQGEDRLKDDIAYTTGVDKNANIPNPGATATEVASNKEATLKRVAKKIYQTQLSLEQRRGRLILAYIMQYYTLPRVEQVTGPEAVEEYQEAMKKVKEDPEHYFTGEDQAVYKKSYRQIRVDNKAISVKPIKDGYNKIVDVQLKISDKKGYTFFEATPEIIKGEFDYIITPDIEIPVTKAQKAELANGLYDRLKDNPVINSPDGKMYINTAQGQVAAPMPKGILKLTEDLLKESGKNFEDYIPDEADLDPMIGQAGKENVVMMAGEPLNATPLATPEHTQVHLDFLKANQLDEKSPELSKIFTEHIVQEQRWQKQMNEKMDQQQKQALAAKQQPDGQTQPQQTDPGAGGAPGGVPGQQGIPTLPSVAAGAPSGNGASGPAYGGPAPTN